jgi:hypothetical protein
MGHAGGVHGKGVSLARHAGARVAVLVGWLVTMVATLSRLETCKLGAGLLTNTSASGARHLPAGHVGLGRLTTVE